MTISEATAGEPPLDDTGGLLAAFRASKRAEAAEQVRQVELALDYCAFNSPDSRRPAATLPGTEGELTLAGEGAPGVAEFAVVELGAAAGISTDAARTYLGRCLELGHRLPRVWAATRAGRVPVWRALRVAEHTMALPADGAAWVDAEVAPVAGRVGPVILERLVQEAICRFDPETAAQLAFEALETRHATLTIDSVLHAALATGRLDAVLDVADALDLDAALADLAADLATAGDTDPLDVRRAKALGLLARGETPTLPDRPRPRRRPREVTLHVHLTEAALRGYGDGLPTVKTHSGHPLGLVTVEQVQDWCARPGANVTVRPVLDLAETLTSTGYRPSGRLRAQVVAITPTCAFVHCDRPAENLDLDHIEAYDPDDPATATTTDNLAPLCRRHHRAKTHGGWTYQRLGPAEYLWTSPYGYRWITDPDGTREVSGRAGDDLSTGPP